jgi:hypothetical protein
MTTPPNQTQPLPTTLEQAIKRHFEQDSLPDFGNYLLPKILTRLSYEQELKILKPKLWAAAGIFVCGLGLLVLAAGVSWNAFAQTPTAHYFSLMFTDFSLIMANWQDYALGVLESLPLGSLALLLSSLLGSLLLVDFATRRLFSFRKTLNSLHYGPR